jgi:pyruvate/2-oxoglutarate dehydrogenase complex dihydrolipoamide dehydrogenase (E3) component
MRASRRVSSRSGARHRRPDAICRRGAGNPVPSRGRTYAETAAWAKVLIDKQTDRIVGAPILGHAGEELIHIFALAMKHGITAGEVKDLIYGFPSCAVRNPSSG